MADCSFELDKCKNEVIAWVRKKDDSIRFWYALCEEHLHFIILTNTLGIEIEQLQLEKIRQLRLKRYDKKKIVNWKMFLDWEELEYHPNIQDFELSEGDIKITLALEEHRKKNVKKYIKKNKKFMIKLDGLSEDMEEFILEQDDYFSHNKTDFWTSFYHTCVKMWTNRVDLTDKQLNIIYREYKKVAKKRKEEFKNA
ncbi:MAG: hypothetical protein ACFFCI_17875 [Promethearchaeota archaeon]